MGRRVWGLGQQAVSIDWFSNDIDVMGDTFATKIRPTEVSFIDNEKMDPVCKECTIEALEKIKAKLKAENKMQVEKNKKALHDGTYKPKQWAGWPWDRE